MTIVASAVPSLDLNALGSNLAVLVVAIGAVTAGIWRGWQKIKKTLTETEIPAVVPAGEERLKLISATIVETSSLTMLSESNRQLDRSVCELDRSVENAQEELKQHRYSMDRMSENLARLTSALEHNSRTMDRTSIK